MVIQQKRQQPLPTVDCPVCGDPFKKKYRNQKSCGETCGDVLRSASNRKDPAERKVRDQHRQIYEQSRGVKLKSHHRVKWLNGDKSDNRPENLALANPHLEEYVRQHGKLPAALGKDICTKCGNEKEPVSRSRTTGKVTYGCKKCNAERLRKHRREASSRADVRR